MNARISAGTRTRTSAGARHAARAQSLSRGATGMALLPIERAHCGAGTWRAVHTAITVAARHELVADDHASLYFGAPAVAYALHTAAGGSGRYAGALSELDRRVTALTERRLVKAHARIDRGQRPRLSEFDTLYGLTGLGAYFLRRAPHHPTLRGVLSYLVRLTEPLSQDGETLPGWWTPFDPTGHMSSRFPGGHGNLGLAHGITGPLALLALAKRRGITVRGQVRAVDRICTWLDTFRQEPSAGTWWPGWVTREEHGTGRVEQYGPPRPSWCYGTPGTARAQQLAGLALRDVGRQRLAEDAMHGCLTDRRQLDRLTDRGLCHGVAGLLRTVQRMHEDAASDFTRHLPHLRDRLIALAPPAERGLLEGVDGTALALHSAEAGRSPASGWDACLLIT